MKALQAQILKGSIGLSIFAVVTAGLIAVTQLSTADKISAEIKKAQSKALLQIIPPNEHDNELIEDVIALPSTSLLGNAGTDNYAHVSRLKGNVTAFILPVTAPDGYSGAIKMIVGIDTDGNIKGLRVLSHKETPGLGDKVDIKKSPWVTSFNGKSLNSPKPDQWKVVKDGGEFDQFTGATITPRAVVNATRRALSYFDENKATIINMASQKSSTDNSQPGAKN
jgi:electron transport complex protein RnfG